VAAVTARPAPPPAADGIPMVAGEHATSSVPVGAPSDTAAEVRRALGGRRYEWAGDVAVLAGDALAGIVSIEALLAAPPEARLEQLMDPDPPVVAPGHDQEAVAWKMVERGEASIAVVDGRGRFQGLIPPPRMLGVLLAEHDEDLARLGGYLASTKRARDAAEEPIGRRLWHRLPWLLLGLVGAMASAVIVAAFERQLDAKVLIAFFVPGIVYMADAVGTQTEAILIRGLSVGIDVRRVVRRELVSGLLIGAGVGAAFFALSLAVWGDLRASVAVGLALLASCSVATLVAMTLPWLFQRLGHDPAFGSGPLATVVQDLLSIAVYLTLATWIAV
jgi:magnesium transporter